MAAHVQDTIMLLGDSLTQGGYDLNGFATRLAHVYNRKMDVINRGYSGYNTDWILPVFEQCFAAQHDQRHLPRVRLLVVWFGANDAVLPPKDQYVPLDRFKANLSKLVWMVSSPESPRYSPATKVVLMTPPPVNTEQWGARQAAQSPPRPLDRDFEVTRTYAEAVKEVAGKEHVAVVDLWTRLYDAAGKDEKALANYLTDGLHLNQDGYAIVFEELIKTIAENYPEYHHDNLQFVFVPHDAIYEHLPEYTNILQKRSIFPK